MIWSLSRPFGTARRRSERLAIAIAVGAMGTLGFSVTSPILPDLADAFGVSRGDIGLVQAAVSIPGVVFSALIGYFADKFGRRKVVLTSLTIFTIFGLAGFWATTYWGLVTVRFFQGIGTSGILGLGIVLIGDNFEGRARTRAMGINITGVTLVSMTGPIIAGQLALGGTFRPFLIFIIGLPLFTWATRMPSDPARDAVAPPFGHLAAAFRAMKESGRLRDYLGLLGTTLVAVFILHGLGLTVAPLFLDLEFGVPVDVRGLIVAAFQAGTILVALQVGRILSRIGGRKMITIAFAAMAMGSGAAAMATTPWHIAAGLGLAGLGFGLFVPVAQSFASLVGTDQYRGLTVLMWVTIVRVAQVIGPQVGSRLADSATSGPRLAFGIAAAGMGFIAVGWVPLRKLINRGVTAQPVSS